MAVAAAIVAADQGTKALALRALDDGPIHLVGPVRLHLTYNTAAAFGLGGAFVPFLAVAAMIVVAVIVTRSDATARPLVAVASGLVLGGALGNVVDRVARSPGWLRGAVVDFVDLRWWPVFNLADAAITCGCVVLFWSGWRAREP